MIHATIWGRPIAEVPWVNPYNGKIEWICFAYNVGYQPPRYSVLVVISR